MLARRRPATAAGLTLVEALLALAILSISIFVLIDATAKCLAMIRLSKNYQTARMVLDQGEAEHPLNATNEPDDNEVSDVVYDNGYTYSRKLLPVEGEKKLFMVQTRVAWTEAEQAAFEEVTSYLYCPKVE